MTETKNTPTEPIPVNTKKLIDGIGTIFGGVIQLLAAMEPNMAKELDDMVIIGVTKEKEPDFFNPDDFEEIIAADGLPWDTEPEQSKQEEKFKPKETATKKEQTNLTVDDLIKVSIQLPSLPMRVKENRNPTIDAGSAAQSLRVRRVPMKPLALCRKDFLDLDTGAFDDTAEESDMTAPYHADTQTAVFKQPGLIPLSELAEILPTLNRISSWIEAVFAFVSSEAINHGIPIPGYKVV